MKTQRFALVVTVIALCAACTSRTPVKSIENLKKAIKGETWVYSKYTMYSKVAQDEGYPNIAKAFSAVAAAELVHCKNHNATLVKLGEKEIAVTPTEEAKSGTTAENLKAAIEGELFEDIVMYAEFIATAQVEKSPDAIQTFTMASDAEKVHVKLFSSILENLTANGNDSKVASTWYNCPECGKVYGSIENMQSCGKTPSSSFEQF